MKTIQSVAGMRAERAAMRGSVGLAPTMGYLHEGHLSLVRAARQQNDNVVVSIFVNPTQFGPHEDFERYPRDPERDLRLLEQEGCDLIFVPSGDEMYPPGFDEWVELRGPLVERLEGAARPGHFRGVTTVVARLFRIIEPHRAYFGEKDAQQLRVVRRMARDLGLPVEVVGRPTVREPDGLAMSSRNVYLSPKERQAALVLSRSLDLGSRLFREQGERDAAKILDVVRECIEGEPLVRLEYVSLADDETLEELPKVDRPALLLVAARVGTTRLIDNIPLP